MSRRPGKQPELMWINVVAYQVGLSRPARGSQMSVSNSGSGPFSVGELRSALDKVVETLPGSRQGPSVRACLAQQLLALAAAKRADSLTELSDIALRGVAANCLNCLGCEGVPSPRPMNAFSPEQGVERQARMSNITAHLDEWVNSIGLKPPSK